MNRSVRVAALAVLLVVVAAMLSACDIPPPAPGFTPPPPDFTNPNDCTESTAAAPPTITNVAVATPTLSPGDTGTMSITFQSECGWLTSGPQSGLDSTPANPTYTDPYLYMSANFPVTFLAQCDLRTDNDGFSLVQEPPGTTTNSLSTNCSSASGGLRWYARDPGEAAEPWGLTSGTWSGGTITIDFKVQSCVSGSVAWPAIDIEDWAGRTTHIEDNDVVSQYPNATVTCA